MGAPSGQSSNRAAAYQPARQPTSLMVFGATVVLICAEVYVNHRFHLSCITAGILLLIATAPLRAHHSGAMYDAEKTDTLQGTVRIFQWSNPHCWIQLLVPKDGVTQEWSVEMGSTAELYRSGWRPTTVKQGDKLTIAVHLMRDGSPGAHFLSAVGPDGTPLGKPKTGNVP